MNLQSQVSSNEEQFIGFLNRGKAPEDYERQTLKDRKRVDAIFKQIFLPPYELEIQPSSFCNLKCSHCLGKGVCGLRTVITKSILEKIVSDVEEFQDNGFRTEVIKFCGTTGEPLMNPAVAYGIKKFKQKGRKIVLFTNGVLLDKSFGYGSTYIDVMDSVDRLNVSLDAGSESVFKKVKKAEGFERAIRNIGQVSEKKRKEGFPLNLVVSYVINTDNYLDLINAAKRVKNAGADELRLRVDFLDPSGIRNISEEIIENIGFAKEHSENGFKVVSVYSDTEIRENGKGEIFHSCGRKCFTHNLWGCIGPDAELYACGHRTHGCVESYGSLLKHSLKDLWKGPKRREGVFSLPDEKCIVCSPSSLRRNTFLTFLSGIESEERDYLLDKYSSS